jgi:hypothetical protein
MNKCTPFQLTGLLLLIGIALYLLLNNWLSPQNTTVTNFEECERAGYNVAESFPRQCWTPDGRRFVEDLSQIIIPNTQPITITGEITCLPKVGDGAQTMECAIGLLSTDGLYYGLNDLFEHDPEYNLAIGGTQVEVTGNFSPEEMIGPDGNNYDIVGVIYITSIREIN